MKTQVVNRKDLMFIWVTLLIGFGVQGSYGQTITASAQEPLTEANLHGSVVTLTLAGGTYEEFIWGEMVTVSGIDGVDFVSWNVERLDDTQMMVELTFDGDFDADATLTFTVEADAVAGYNQGFTAEIPVTAIQKSDATVSISPLLVVSPDVGEELTFSVNIVGGENVVGYQVAVSFDFNALQPIASPNPTLTLFNSFGLSFTKGDYLPEGVFFADIVDYWIDTSPTESILAQKVRLTANTLTGAANGDGTLASLTFKVGDFKPSTLTLSQVYLVDSDGKRWEAAIQNGVVTIPPEPAEAILGDINRDGVVDILDLTIVGVRLGDRGQNSADLNRDGLIDIVDLVLVAGAFTDEAEAPSVYPQALDLLTATDVQSWLTQAQQLALTDPSYLRGITVLEQLHAVLTPKETTLLPNYPNPFNPETWIPYRLAEDAFVTLIIYDSSGQVVRTLDIEHQTVAFYESRSKAIHWDGRNELGSR